MNNSPILLETFSVKDSYTELLDFHSRRILTTAKELDFCPPDIMDFINILNNVPQIGHFKCSIQYSNKIITYHKETEYKKRYISKIKIIEICKNIYKYKFADRSCFSRYDCLVSENEEILFSLNGFLTDTRYTNIVLETEQGNLITPKKPLLQGTRRDYLINEKLLTTRDICTQDIFKYKKIHLINSLLPLDSISLEITRDTIII